MCFEEKKNTGNFRNNQHWHFYRMKQTFYKDEIGASRVNKGTSWTEQSLCFEAERGWFPRPQWLDFGE